MGADEHHMSQVKANMAKRIKKGKLKTGYDPYNDKDLDEASGTLSTNQNIGQIGVFVIWGKRDASRDTTSQGIRCGTTNPRDESTRKKG